MPADYASGSTAERLQAVRESIKRVLVIQRYGTGARDDEMPSLDTLFRMEQALIAQLNAESSGGGLHLGQIMEPEGPH